jgi:hypothetical protein
MGEFPITYKEFPLTRTGIQDYYVLCYSVPFSQHEQFWQKFLKDPQTSNKAILVSLTQRTLGPIHENVLILRNLKAVFF